VEYVVPSSVVINALVAGEPFVVVKLVAGTSEAEVEVVY
jgi:hypothetical protein